MRDRVFDRSVAERGLVAALAVVGLAGCDSAPPHAVHDAATTGVSSPTVIDSIRPIEDELRLFRASLKDHPVRLSNGAASMDELVLAMAAAINEGDAAGLASLAVTRSEFAYFHYPHSRYVAPPYELSPSLVWYRLTSRSDRGAKRLLATFESRDLEVGGLACDAPVPAGAGRLHDCVVEVRDADGRWVTVRIFGRILERDGRYKFLSLANDL